VGGGGCGVSDQIRLDQIRSAWGVVDQVEVRINCD
jgi:hypothetical protein